MRPVGFSSRRSVTAMRIAGLALLACSVGHAGCGDGAAPAVVLCSDALTPKRIADTAGIVHAIDVRGTTLLAASVEPIAQDGEILLFDLATGAARTLAMSRHSPYAVSANSRFAYWIDSGAAGAPEPLALMRAPLDASAGPELFSPVTYGPTDTMVDGETLFFGHEGALAALTSDAGVPADIVPEAYPLNLASDADNIYWTACGSGVQRIGKGGGSVQQVGDAYCAMALTTDGADVFLLDAFTMTSSGEYLGGNQIRRVPASGGTESAVVTGGTIVASLAMDDRNVYYATGDGLYRISRAGGDPEPLAAGMITDLAADGACVYWGDSTQTGVFALRK